MVNRFEERYRSGDLPWDHGTVDSNLVKTVASMGIEPCRVLDIGCGTGDNALWLAEQGFDTVAFDHSETAIKLARGKADSSGTTCHFLVADFLADPVPGEPFGFVFDRGCLHCMDSLDEKNSFAKKVDDLLEPQGLWLTLVGNSDEPEREIGPPQFTAAELVSIVEPYFEVLSLASGEFGSNQDEPPRAWICLMRKRS